MLTWGYARSLLPADGGAPTKRSKLKIDVHAEADAVAHAARRGVALDGATCHVTGSPCATCLALLIVAGVRRVEFVGRVEDHSGKADHLRELAAHGGVALAGGQPMPAFAPVDDASRVLFRPDLP